MLTAAELNLLGRLDLAHRRPQSGLYAGERRSPRAARSPEFSDFRPYVSGDDFRQIDWRGFSPFEELMLRLFGGEEGGWLDGRLGRRWWIGSGRPAEWPGGPWP